MSNFSSSRKKKQQIQLSNKLKQNKNLFKPIIQDIYPIDVTNLQSLKPQVKQYINQLQKQYIERYNILISNRILYQQLIQNISTQLDQKGVSRDKLADVYKMVKLTQPKAEVSDR